MKGLKLTPTAKLSEKDWQELRQSFVLKGMVGGSDAGCLLGWSAYKSPISLYYQAIGLSPLPSMMNRQMAFGKLLESTIMNAWQYWDGEQAFIENVISGNRPRRFRKLKAIVENPKYPQLFANIDGLVTKHPVKGKKKGILEIKNVGGMTVDKYAGGIPPTYIAQVQHYMMILQLDYAEICMQVDGQNMKVELFEADDEIQQAILRAASDHQWRVLSALDKIRSSGVDDKEELYGIAAEFEPDADSSEDFDAFISAKHKARASENTIQGTPEHQALAEAYCAQQKLLKQGEEEKLRIGNILKQEMEKNAASIMELPNGKITWRKSFLVRIDKTIEDA